MKQLVSVKEEAHAEQARTLSRPLDSFSLEDQQRLQPADDEFQAWVGCLGHPFLHHVLLVIQNLCIHVCVCVCVHAFACPAIDWIFKILFLWVSMCWTVRVLVLPCERFVVFFLFMALAIVLWLEFSLFESPPESHCDVYFQKPVGKKAFPWINFAEMGQLKAVQLLSEVCDAQCYKHLLSKCMALNVFRKC